MGETDVETSGKSVQPLSTRVRDKRMGVVLRKSHAPVVARPRYGGGAAHARGLGAPMFCRRTLTPRPPQKTKPRQQCRP